MSELDLTRRKSLPDALRVLVEELPREGWEAHPEFSPLVRFWLDRHVMFRDLLSRLGADTREALDGNLDPMSYARALGRLGSAFCGELHMHHNIEDAHYFPVLAPLDARVARGFELLDADHHAIDPMLQAFADRANAVLRDPIPGGDLTDRLGAVGRELDGMAIALDRHLTDEEELVVPVLLKHAPDGLA